MMYYGRTIAVGKWKNNAKEKNIYNARFTL